MDWSNILKQGSAGLSSSGVLNTNLNSYKNPKNFQDELNNFGSGITGEDPIMKMISSFSNKPLDNIRSQLDVWSSNNPNIVSNSDLLVAYDNVEPLKKVKLDSFGRLLGDNLLASAQGASNGLSYSGGNPWAALAGGILGGVTNLVGLGAHASKVDDLNDSISNANTNKTAGLFDKIDSINKVSNYTSKINTFAAGGNLENLTAFNTGGSHEQNPLGGIPQGIGKNGKQNVVEQGEIKSNLNNTENYVFSKRFVATESDLKAASLPTVYKNKTISEIAIDLGKESKERPNDPISKRGLDEMLTRLKSIQEAKRRVLIEEQIKKTASRYNIAPEEAAKVVLGSEDQNSFATLGQMDYLSNPKKPISAIISNEGQQFNNQISNEALMYSPIVGGIGMLGRQIAKGIDYFNANSIAKIKTPRITTPVLRDYMEYTPVDSTYRTNQMLSSASNLRSRLMDSAGNNAAVARATMLASNKDINDSIGKSFYEDANTNFERRRIAKEFNRGTNQANSELFARIAAINTEAEARDNENLVKSILLREQLKSDYETGISGTYSNIFQNASEIGKYKYNANTLKAMFGNLGYDQEGNLRYTKQ